MTNIFIFSPFSLENGRGGEISSMELASGLKNYFNVEFMDTNIVTSEKLLSKDTIRNNLKGVNYIGQMNFFIYGIFNKIFTLPPPKELLKLLKIVKRNKIVYFSLFNFKNVLTFILLSLICRKTQFIIGYRKPLSSEKIISLYNLKFRLSILVLSLFKKKFNHHTISRNAKTFLTNFYDENKVFHIIHGIDLDDYKGDTFSKKNNKHLNFVYVGYLDDVHKGIGTMLEALDGFLGENQKLKVRFEFCGMGPLESRLRAISEKYPKHIKFNGYISNEKISEYYKINDVFLFTSRREPFGRVLIEAMAAGLLIICSKTIGSIEILNGKDFAFFLQDLNSNEIIAKIKEVYDLWWMQRNNFRKLQESSKLFALQSYSFTVEIEMFRNLIERLLKT
ncbi:MAG: glycosyltransferase family 4 protein [Promethearchaeota archaeon]